MDLGKQNTSLKIDDISAITVSSSALEEIIGVTSRRIRQLAEEGILIRASKGRYKLSESLRNYVMTLKVAMESSEKDTTDGGFDLDTEKAIHEKVKRQISELKLSVMQGELHKSCDVEMVMTDMLLRTRSKLLSMPAKLAPILVNTMDAGKIQDNIQKEVLEVLLELKDYNPKEFNNNEVVEIEDDEDS